MIYYTYVYIYIYIYRAVRRARAGGLLGWAGARAGREGCGRNTIHDDVRWCTMMHYTMIIIRTMLYSNSYNVHYDTKMIVRTRGARMRVVRVAPCLSPPPYSTA